MNDSIINLEAALARLDGDRSLYDELVGLYLEDTPLQLAELSQATKENNQEATKRHAHSIKSASATIGAEVMAKKAAVIEFAATVNNEEIGGKEKREEADLYFLVNDLSSEFTKLKTVLENTRKH